MSSLHVLEGFSLYAACPALTFRTIGRRVEKLETHVVTLAQSVAEISSDLEHLRLNAPSVRSPGGSSTALRAPITSAATALALPSPPSSDVADKTKPPGAPSTASPAGDGVSVGSKRLQHLLRHPHRLAKLKW